MIHYKSNVIYHTIILPVFYYVNVALSINHCQKKKKINSKLSIPHQHSEIVIK
jgi:hypothetical protein